MRTRLLLLALIAVALVLAGTRVAELVAMDASARPPMRLTGAFLALSAYAAMLAAFVAWHLPARADGRWLAFAYGSLALMLAIAVTPSGDAGVMSNIGFTAAYIAFFGGLIGFTRRFPRYATREELLAPAPAGHPLVHAVDRSLDGFKRAYLQRRWLVWSLVASLGIFQFLTTEAGYGFAYNIYYLDMRSSPTATLLASAIFGTFVVLFPMALIWSSYRRSDTDTRRRAQWVMLGVSFAMLWLFLWLSLNLLSQATGNAAVEWLYLSINRIQLQVMYFVAVTSFAIALLYSGAMDLKPAIRRTSLYGVMIILLTVVFAGVEQLATSQLTARLQLPDGTGNWLGAAAVALVLMPLQDRLKGWLKRLGD